jgi:Domain of unknown function (DUF4156)
MLKPRALLCLSVLSACFFPGCFPNVVALEPKAEGVKIVHETDKPLRCEVQGKISGTSRSADEKEGRTGAENDFRNHAAALKANFAFVEHERNGPVGTSSQKDYYLGGKALICQTEAMEEAEDKAQAAEREQKEKAEAEREQKEADEKKEQAKAKKKGHK